MLRWKHGLAPVALFVSISGIGCAGLGTQGVGVEEEVDLPRRNSAEWYEGQAEAPVGARQVHKYGKDWPPYPRPTGPRQQFSHIYHANHYWPHPYVCHDRAAVNELSEIQIQNGWIEETTLFDYHFHPETNELNHSGKLHLRWIIENVPINRRTAWVQAGQDVAMSTARQAAVRNSAVEMFGEANVPPIMVRITSPVGRPASEINEIRKKEMSTIINPRVKLTALPTGASGQQTGN